MSWPARLANGPVWPNPVNRAYISRGLSFIKVSGPRFKFSMTPGRYGSISTSDDLHRVRTNSWPRAFFKLIAIVRFPSPKQSSGFSAIRSIFVTVAPKSDKTMPTGWKRNKTLGELSKDMQNVEVFLPQNGAGAKPANSKTFIPLKAITDVA